LTLRARSSFGLKLREVSSQPAIRKVLREAALDVRLRTDAAGLARASNFPA